MADAAPAAAGSETAGQTGFSDALVSAEAWCLLLVQKHLDPPGRLALYRTNRACRLCVVEASQQATITLLAYGGLPEAAWERRLASAAPDLAARGLPAGQQRETRLFLRLPTHIEPALQAVLAMAPEARRCVTALEVRAYDYSADQSAEPHTAWLQAMPAAFTNLRVLRLQHMCGRLPDPALLPHLGDLHVTLWVGSDLQQNTATITDSLSARCASIAPYTPQLTSLTIWQEGSLLSVLQWPQIINTGSPSLTHFSTNSGLVDDYLPLLLKHAPGLEHMCCNTDGLTRDFSGSTWDVKRITLPYRMFSAVNLALLPHSSNGVDVSPSEGCSTVDIDVPVASREGLPHTGAQWLAQCRFTAPCVVTLNLPYSLSPADLHAGIAAALTQLSAVLPAGSTIEMTGDNETRDEATWREQYMAACDALAATGAAAGDTGAARAHLTIHTPPAPGSDSSIETLTLHRPPSNCVGVVELRVSGVHNQMAWPWQRLRVIGDYNCEVSLTHLLNLPDPTDGQYEIETTNLAINTGQWMPWMYTQLYQRLPHWTFIIGHHHLSIDLTAPHRTTPTTQPAALRDALQALRHVRWRAEDPKGEVTLTLLFWSLTPALVSELAHLPTAFEGVQVQLSLLGCDWQPECSGAELASAVPACYTRWSIWASASRSRRMATAEQLIGVCAGLQAREGQGKGGERVTVCVRYQDTDYWTDEKRSQVEAGVEQARVAGCGMVEVEWHLQSTR